MRYTEQVNLPWITDGDRFFDGWISKFHRATLPEGKVAKSINKRFTDRRAGPRKGSVLPNGNRFWFRSDNSQKFLGSTLYVNSAGKERIVMVPTSLNNGTQGVNAYDVDNDNYITIGLPPGVTIGPNNPVWFAQAFGQLVMLVYGITNGIPSNLTNGLFWDGNESTKQFQFFSWNGIQGTQVIPPSAFAVPVSDRMAYWYTFLPPTDHPLFGLNGLVYDHLLISDVWGSGELNPYQNLAPGLQDFTINAGSTDQIVAVLPFQFDYLIIGMKRSICSLSSFSLDPTLFQTSVLTSYMGVVGPRAMIQIGTEVYFVSERRGLFKLSQVYDQQIVVPPLPITDNIQPDIDRINWKYGSTIILAAEENYLFMAAPIDGRTKPNAVFVINLTTMECETLETYPAQNFSIDNLIPVHINGVRRLVAIQNGPPALVWLLYEGQMDQTVFDVINPRFVPVSDYMETRGYGINKDIDPTAWGNFRRGSIVMETQNPNVQVTAITEGVNEVKTLRQSITKDRTKFYIHGKADWFPGNDPLAEKRQDYSLSQTLPQNYAAQDFEQVPLGPIVLSTLEFPLAPVGVDPFDAPKQVSRERFPIRMTDRWVSLGIGNTQGTATVVATSVELVEARRNARSAA